jgi:hypothetical protein
MASQSLSNSRADCPRRPQGPRPHQPAGMGPARAGGQHNGFWVQGRAGGIAHRARALPAHAPGHRGHRRHRAGWDRGAQVWCAYEAGFTARHDRASVKALNRSRVTAPSLGQARGRSSGRSTRALSHAEEALDPCDAELRYDLGLGEQSLPQGDATLGGVHRHAVHERMGALLAELGGKASITCLACTKPLVASRLSRMRSTPTSRCSSSLK